MINISVICPIYNEERYIKSFIESVICQDYINGKIEIFLIDGLSSDNTRSIICQYLLTNPTIHLVDNVNKTVSHALNIGVNLAKGDYIIRLDAHTEIPNNYFTELIYYAEKLGADNIGGVINSIPANSTLMCKAIAIAMSNEFGVGNSYFRVGSEKVMIVDTVPFGCFRREIFKRTGLFDVNLIRNQDDEFNARIIKLGMKIFLIPKIKINYYVRETIGKTAKMFYQYGLFKPLVIKKIGFPISYRQFIPLFFVSFLFFGPLFYFSSNFLFNIYLIVIIIYFIISFYFSFILALKEKNFKMLFTLQYVFFIIHLNYGIGYIMGIYYFIILRKNKLKIT
jgi:glycosyltransferase involved in cell wall biosynthesis